MFIYTSMHLITEEFIMRLAMQCSLYLQGHSQNCNIFWGPAPILNLTCRVSSFHEDVNVCEWP